jgi:hypothetical protein
LSAAGALRVSRLRLLAAVAGLAVVCLWRVSKFNI